MKYSKQERLLFNPTRKFFTFSLLAVPLAYILLVRGFQAYWLNNDLRHLYKEILKPYYKRLDDQQCVDYRDLRDELYGNVVDQEKSMVIKMRKQVENKVLANKYHTEEKESGSSSNLNLIKRV